MRVDEIQLTTARQGHLVHHTQVFSPDGQWVVFDTRNDDTHIGRTGTIGRVNVHTGRVETLYRTASQTEYGPGVGAATYSPDGKRVLFIHGPRHADAARPYSMTRRTGVAVDLDRPMFPIFFDARDVVPPFTPGALRGGTHAHSWSADGEWICFTYNDSVLARRTEWDSMVQDLRMVGVMVPGRVDVPDDGSLENHGGEYFAVVVTEVTENPMPGSDQIDKAFDECWIGTDGYIDALGKRKRRSIAFQGNVRDNQGRTVTEVFVADLPDDLTRARSGQPLQGTPDSRPGVPDGVVQRRVTYTERGIAGPRHWLRTTPDGRLILFLATDDRGIVQLFGVSPNGGSIRQLTRLPFPIQGPFNVHPGRAWVACPADNSLLVIELETGRYRRVTPRFADADRPVGAPNWSPDGRSMVYNRYVGEDHARFLQVFLLRMGELS